MAIKTIDETPTIADTIRFTLLTPDADGCFDSDPYKVQRVTIYRVNVDFTSGNYKEYNKKIYNPEALAAYEVARQNACDAATEENLVALQKAQELLSLKNIESTLHFKDTTPVAVIGNSDNPAWLSTDVANARLKLISEDDDGNTQYGHFRLDWEPLGMREGDYFICWTWYPNPAGDSLSAHCYFTLYGSPQLTTSIPTHFVDPEKYETLLNRYMASVFSFTLSDNDLSPEILSEFNASVAEGFTSLEDLSNQIIDLIDANAAHESVLPFLANYFALKLRSSDPTLWRRQIKEAIPTYKKKGTLIGLQDALTTAGISLEKLTKMWQVVSLYTWQEMFDVDDAEDLNFLLERTAILPIDVNNYEIYFRGVNETDWTTLSSDYVSFATDGDGVTTMSWIGHQLSYNPIVLAVGDSVRVIYLVSEVPGTTEQTIETYVRTLPLTDQRDERNQIYPLKNWNVRLIEEDDVYFDVVIQNRHPYYDPVIWGWVRTEFPYSENIYNMEEYNGSARESLDPCDIDRDFLDSCQFCQSSKFTADLEVSELSDDRIIEAQKVIEDYVPFHAVLHSFTVTGKVDDLVQPPVEEIEVLVHIQTEQLTLAGTGHMIFNRVMEDVSQQTREELATMSIVEAGGSGTGANEELVLFCPDVRLDRIGLAPSTGAPAFDDNWLEILAPAADAGNYEVGTAVDHHVPIEVGTPGAPTIGTGFTFNLSNTVYQNTDTDISQDDYFVFSDANVSFETFQTKSSWDVDNTPDYSGGAWTANIPTYGGNYTILQILSDGTLVLENDLSNPLPSAGASSITYTLRNDSGTTIASSTTGAVVVTRRGLVDVSSDTTLIDVRSMMKLGDYALYSGAQYQVIGFIEDETHQYHILDYTAGTASSVTVDAYRRLVDNQTGYLQYKGLQLTTVTNYESTLDIQNGTNPPAVPVEDGLFMENFLVVISGDYYAITAINGTNITLEGPMKNWGISGTAVNFTINKYVPEAFSVSEREWPPMVGHDFGTIDVASGYQSEFRDRRGSEVIQVQTETALAMGMAPMMSTILNAAKNDQIIEEIGQKEEITFTIEWAEDKGE